MKRISSFLAVSLLLIAGQLSAQEKEIEKTNEAFVPHHSIGVVLAHAHVFQGRDAEGNRSVLSLPSWGLDYNYKFHPKWGIGLHTDIIVEKFMVDKHLESGSSGEVLERSHPIAPAILGAFSPNHHWSFLFGAGAEFAKEGNLFLNRAGIEYAAELPRDWEVFGSLAYDIKWNAYDTWVLGIGISRKF